MVDKFNHMQRQVEMPAASAEEIKKSCACATGTGESEGPTPTSSATGTGTGTGESEGADIEQCFSDAATAVLRRAFLFKAQGGQPL